MPDWFEAFMEEQVAEIGEQDPEAWVAAHAEEFRFRFAVARLDVLGE